MANGFFNPNPLGNRPGPGQGFLTRVGGVQGLQALQAPLGAGGLRGAAPVAGPASTPIPTAPRGQGVVGGSNIQFNPQVLAQLQAIQGASRPVLQAPATTPQIAPVQGVAPQVSQPATMTQAPTQLDPVMAALAQMATPEAPAADRGDAFGPGAGDTAGLPAPLPAAPAAPSPTGPNPPGGPFAPPPPPVLPPDGGAPPAPPPPGGQPPPPPGQEPPPEAAGQVLPGFEGTPDFPIQRNPFDPQGQALLEPAEFNNVDTILTNNSAAQAAYQGYLTRGGQLGFDDWFRTLQGRAQGAPDPFRPNTFDNPNIEPTESGDLSQTRRFINEIFLPEIQRAFPGLTTLGNLRLDPNIRSNRLFALAGPFAGGILGTLSAGGQALAGASMNILLREIARQQQRSEQAEQNLRGVIDEAAGSPSLALSNLAQQGAFERIQPGATQQLQDTLTAQARAQAAQQQNAALNALRDLGITGQGGAATGAVSQAANLAGRNLQRNLTDIELGIQEEQRRRLEQAGGLAATGTDIFGRLVTQPRAALTDLLRQIENPAVGPFSNLMQNLAQLAEGQALATQEPSFFQQAAPILGSLIGAGGTIGSRFIPQR